MNKQIVLFRVMPNTLFLDGVSVCYPPAEPSIGTIKALFHEIHVYRADSLLEVKGGKKRSLNASYSENEKIYRKIKKPDSGPSYKENSVSVAIAAALVLIAWASYWQLV